MYLTKSLKVYELSDVVSVDSINKIFMIEGLVFLGESVLKRVPPRVLRPQIVRGTHWYYKKSFLQVLMKLIDSKELLNKLWSRLNINCFSCSTVLYLNLPDYRVVNRDVWRLVVSLKSQERNLCDDVCHDVWIRRPNSSGPTYLGFSYVWISYLFFWLYNEVFCVTPRDV